MKPDCRKWLQTLRLSSVSVVLLKAPSRTLSPSPAARFQRLLVFAETLARPYCGSTAGFGTASWFGEHAPHIRSQALIALRNGGGTIGLVALGSEEGQRFYTDMGTLYLERIGAPFDNELAKRAGVGLLACSFWHSLQSCS